MTPSPFIMTLFMSCMAAPPSSLKEGLGRVRRSVEDRVRERKSDCRGKMRTRGVTGENRRWKG